MNDFKPFEDKLAGLIAALSPAGRRRMTADIAKKMRQRQQQRIKSQKAPDGSPFSPRKRQPVRAKKGRIKREMFAKLRTNRYMKATGNDSAAVVEFTGKVQCISSDSRINHPPKAPPSSTHSASSWALPKMTGSLWKASLSTTSPINVVPARAKRPQIAAGTPRRHPFPYEYSRIYPGTRPRDTQHDPHRHRRRN
ncbi:hypothetical protein SB00094_02493 [Klebsiella variicola subsp. tropica]|nr:hypothetical protein SB00094_02493 [Klebsiella variicola subsp. tropica]